MSREDNPVIQNFREWIKNVMTKTIKNFGSGYKLIEPTLSEDEILKNFANAIIDVKMKYEENLTNERKFAYIRLKRPVQKTDQLIRSVMAFHDEVIFYQIYVLSNDNFPTCYYSNWMTLNDKVIVLQRIEEYGYYTFSSFQFNSRVYKLPVNRTMMVMREIGRFHAKGYVMKELHKETFFNIVKLFRQNRFEQMSNAQIFFKLLAKRTRKYLRSQNFQPFICERTEVILSGAMQVLMKVIQNSLESSLSTLCHGDLRSCNIFFNDDNVERPVMLSNFGFVMYAPPAIDLSTYIYLCCTYEERNMNLLEYLKAYHDALKECLQHAGIPNMGNYTFETFVNSYKRCCITGLVIACFSLPVIIGRVTEEEQNTMTVWDYVRHIVEDKTDEMPKKVTEMIMHLDSLECLRILDL